VKTTANQPLETNRRHALPLDATWRFARAVHAQACVSGGGRSALRWGGEMMKYGILALLLAVCTAQADDHVTIEYNSGNSMSDRAVTITIGRPFDKSGTLIPEVFKRLKAITVLKTKSFMVPDAAYITIAVEMDGQRLESSSCHTLFEANRNLVAGSRGVSALDGVTREKALSPEPKDFMEFRRLWEEALSISMKSVTETFKPQFRCHGGLKRSPTQGDAVLE